jgi:hypothetical protein
MPAGHLLYIRRRQLKKREIRRTKCYSEPKNYLYRDYATDDFLRKHFRFDRAGIQAICDIIRDQIDEHIYNNGRPISLQVKVE